MKRSGVGVILGTVFATCVCFQDICASQTVLSYHGHPDRNGNFIVPSLTWDKARRLHLDEGFRARMPGHLYAQPLYWRAPGSASGILLLATEDNVVSAIDAVSGHEVWRKALGKPVPRSSLSCGNINPLGITGTPVIDESSETIYFDSAVQEETGPHHLVFALSLKDGAALKGWPIDIAEALAAQHIDFVSRDQNQRGALTILNGMLYVPFGGHYGDCGQYRGFVVGIPMSNPHSTLSWATRARGGGIWAPGGIVSDGRSLFVATGNTIGAATWSDGEAIVRLAPDLHHSRDNTDFFAPADWHALDLRDADLGGTNPLPLDVPASSGNQKLILALGKDGKAYLLDRDNLGGLGGALVTDRVADSAILGAPAAYPASDGVFVAFAGIGTHCPAAAGGSGIVALKIQVGSPPKMTTGWCGGLRGLGSPIVTTTDGRANPIVWIVGAESDNRLHGFRGDTGEVLIVAPTSAMTGLRHFQTLIATPDRLYVGADGGIYAFAF
jgi:outer membrane protein assembly factor BamB